jgi:hypothetical protein
MVIGLVRKEAVRKERFRIEKYEQRIMELRARFLFVDSISTAFPTRNSCQPSLFKVVNVFVKSHMSLK